LVQHFAKKQKEAKTVAKKKHIKSNMEMNEGKNKIYVRYICGIADGHSHKYAVPDKLINHSRFNGKSDKSI
jgi:hypothetical protein